MSYTIFDGLAMDAEPGKLPRQWRLLAAGDNRLTVNGETRNLPLTPAQIAAIADYNRAKGETIPIDSRHALLLAAQKHGVEESDVKQLLPHGVGALGYARLEARADGLYAVDVEWLPLAAKLVKEGMFRYFSPVIRGLDGVSPLRVTSIALDNVPALNNLDMIAAGGEPAAWLQPIKKEVTMTKTEIALRKLLGDPALALGAEENDAATALRIEALADELPGLRAKAGQADVLALAAETNRRDSLIADALAKGKLCNAQKPWAKTLSLVALSDFLEQTPEGTVVPVEKLPTADEITEGKVELTEEEKATIQRLGITEEEYIASKKTLEKVEEVTDDQN